MFAAAVTFDGMAKAHDESNETTKRVAVAGRVPPKVAERIETIAKDDDRKVGYIVSLILEEWFAKGGKPPAKPKR